MQNKPNLLDAQMNVNPYNTTDYENKSNWTLGQNKPNSNPIAERVKLMQSVYLQRIMKKNAAKGYEKTKPKQTQTNPISNGPLFFWFVMPFVSILWLKISLCRRNTSRFIFRFKQRFIIPLLIAEKLKFTNQDLFLAGESSQDYRQIVPGLFQGRH